MALQTERYSLRISCMTIEGAHGHERILAVDVRPRWLGFAVLGSPAQLLDFGVARVASFARGELFLIRLMKTSRPRLVVIRRTPPRARRHRRGVRVYSRLIPHLARRLSIKVERISDRQLRQYFESQGMRSKEEAAAVLARQFSELSWESAATPKTLATRAQEHAHFRRGRARHDPIVLQE